MDNKLDGDKDIPWPSLEQDRNKATQPSQND